MKRTVIVIAAAALGLAGCSSSAQPAPTSDTGPTAATGGSTAAPRAGVSGLVAAITGTTAQVQGPNQQTAVTWTRATRFTDQVTVPASAVKVGDCVMRGPRAAPAARRAAPDRRAPWPPPPSSCSPCRGARAPSAVSPAAPAPGRRERPTGTATPGTGGAKGAGRRGLGAVGTVSAVRSGQFTVTPVAPSDATTTAPISVTYTSSTVFTRLTAASASAVKVGVCVAAQGRTDDTGAVTARTIAVSAPTNGTCVSGFGGRGLGGGGRGTSGGGGGGGGWPRRRPHEHRRNRQRLTALASAAGRSSTYPARSSSRLRRSRWPAGPLRPSPSRWDSLQTRCACRCRHLPACSPEWVGCRSSPGAGPRVER